MHSIHARVRDGRSHPRFRYPQPPSGESVMIAASLTGPQRLDDVGPCKATSGTPSAAAMCITPVFTLTTRLDCARIDAVCFRLTPAAFFKRPRDREEVSAIKASLQA